MNLPPHPFCVALQFLTRLPLSLSRPPDAAAQRRSLYWYPAVGLVVGAALLLAAWLTSALPPAPRAALLLALWALLTGLLHLDGLADCADAWLGGHGDRARTLAILKDPRAGSAAVAMLVLVLLLKFAALQTLLASGAATPALLLAPLLARAAVPVLFASTPYVRDGGLGAVLAREADRRALLGVAALAALPALACGAWAALLAVAGVGFFVRALALRRLGGFTGDVAGALIELAEAAALLTCL